jgi:hypothetical protein
VEKNFRELCSDKSSGKRVLGVATETEAMESSFRGCSMADDRFLMEYYILRNIN